MQLTMEVTGSLNQESKQDNHEMVTQELSTEVQSPLCGLRSWLQVFSFLHDHITIGSLCTQSSYRRSLDLFYDTDRTSKKPDYDGLYEVLELVLSQNHSAGAFFSPKYSVVVEVADEEELRPPDEVYSTSIFRRLMENGKCFSKLMSSSNDTSSEEDQRVQVEPTGFELLLGCEQIASEQVSPKVSVFMRTANKEEVMPFEVKFHPKHQGYPEKIRNFLTKSIKTCNDGVQSANELRSKIPKCDIDEGMIPQIDSYESTMTKIPDEIEIAVPKTKKVPEMRQEIVWPQEHQKDMWIPDCDVVLGTREITTKATGIFCTRVMPIYTFKEKLNVGNVSVMKHMLLQELKEELMLQRHHMAGPIFWVKVVDADENMDENSNESEERIAHEIRWLRKDDGDFVGPFVKACDKVIRNKLNECKEEEREDLSRSIEQDPPANESVDQIESMRMSMSLRDPEPRETGDIIQSAVANNSIISATGAVSTEHKNNNAEKPDTFKPFFALTGPIETLDEQARSTCQKWLDDSETLLVKVAKKCCIESFHADFQAFLSLFQLQLKRIKERKQSTDKFSGLRENSSWVNWEPNVEEEDYRIASIENACILFLNQMGNDMVQHYAMLSKEAALEKRDDHFSAASTQQAENLTNANNTRQASPANVTRSLQIQASCSSKTESRERISVKYSHSFQSTDRQYDKYEYNPALKATPSSDTTKPLLIAVRGIRDTGVPIETIPSTLSHVRYQRLSSKDEESRGEDDLLSYSSEEETFLDSTTGGDETYGHETSAYDSHSRFSHSVSSRDEEGTDHDDEFTYGSEDDIDHYEDSYYPTDGVETLSPSEISFEDDPEKLRKHWIFQEEWIPRWL